MKQKGFTIVELLVVVAIIALLASIVLTQLGQAQSNARDTKRLTDIKTIEQALELYRVDNSSYPSTIGECGDSWCNGCADSNGLVTALPELIEGGYILEFPKDPRPTTVEGTYACFNYEYISNSNTASTDTCDGVLVSSHDYVLRFQLENPKSGLLPLDSSRPNDYCVFK